MITILIKNTANFDYEYTVGNYVAKVTNEKTNEVITSAQIPELNIYKFTCKKYLDKNDDVQYTLAINVDMATSLPINVIDLIQTNCFLSVDTISISLNGKSAVLNSDYENTSTSNQLNIKLKKIGTYFINFKIRVNQIIVPGLTILNQASASYTFNNNSVAITSNTVVSEYKFPIIEVDKYSLKPNVLSGKNNAYVFHIYNRGNVTANDIVVSDLLDGDVNVIKIGGVLQISALDCQGHDCLNHLIEPTILDNALLKIYLTEIGPQIGIIPNFVTVTTLVTIN